MLSHRQAMTRAATPGQSKQQIGVCAAALQGAPLVPQASIRMSRIARSWHNWRMKHGFRTGRKAPCRLVTDVACGTPRACPCWQQSCATARGSWRSASASASGHWPRRARSAAAAAGWLLARNSACARGSVRDLSAQHGRPAAQRWAGTEVGRPAVQAARLRG